MLLTLSSLQALVRLMPVDIPRLNAVGFDGRLLGFAFLTSLFAGVLFGLVPALHTSKLSLTEALKKSKASSGLAGKGDNRLRGTLVVSEIALAVVLLLGAGLLLRSFLYLTRVDPGFNWRHVLTFQLDSPAQVEAPCCILSASCGANQHASGCAIGQCGRIATLDRR